MVIEANLRALRATNWNSEAELNAEREKLRLSGGEGGIRTPGTGFSQYNGLANRRIQPLCHLSDVWNARTGRIVARQV
jgi:hypothetical protein